MSDEKHVYDGIVEENNAMPTWWIGMFILSIIFAFLYWIHYQFGGGDTLKAEYNMAMKDYENQLEKMNNSAQVETEESLMAYMKNEMNITKGASLFSEKCAMCHGVNLEGKVGPNLTDKFWINGSGTRMDVVNVISKGSPAKGMPPWGPLLKPSEIKNAAAFVFSKIGSNPANAKAPEGNEIK